MRGALWVEGTHTLAGCDLVCRLQEAVTACSSALKAAAVALSPVPHAARSSFTPLNDALSPRMDASS